LVELHGGTVACESHGLGKGSRFTVCLPCQPGTEASADDARQAAPAASQPGRRHVMVVDDNVDAAFTLSLVLEAAGYDVSVEHESARALERAKRETPEACVLDIGLPGMDGNELARRLRAQPETARSLLIAVTGYGQDSDRQQALASGFDHHLVKPVSIDKLNALLAESAS
jgi:CheY-like chemotaxis protein